MNLLLASLRRVEIRIEPQTITDFLKWKNRMQQYNGGVVSGRHGAGPGRAQLFSGERNYRPRQPASLDWTLRGLSSSGHLSSEAIKKKTGLVGPVS